jgi:hypothetical protein
MDGDTEEYIINLILEKIHVDNKRSGFLFIMIKVKGRVRGVQR